MYTPRALVILVVGFLVLLWGCDPSGRKQAPAVTTGQTAAQTASQTAGQTANQTTGQEAGQTAAKLTDEVAVAELGPGTKEQEALLARGKGHFLAGELDKAREAFEALAATEPASAPMVSGTIALGDIYNTQGRLEDAMMLYKLLKVRAPNVPEVHLVIGRTLGNTEKKREALEALQRAVQLQPAYIFLWPEIAELHLKLGEQDASAKAYLAYEKEVQRYVTRLKGRDATPIPERVRIVDVFALIGDDRVTEALIDALKHDPHELIRERAATALGDVEAVSARDVLQTAAASDSSDRVKQAAKQSLHALSGIKQPAADDVAAPTVVKGGADDKANKDNKKP